MKTILILNGHDRYERAQGHLNEALLRETQTMLKGSYQTIQTNIVEGYSVEEEIEKCKVADVMVVQAPVYWFSVPGIVKKYMDDVFVPGIFFTKSSKFGRGGLMTDKNYMLSLTWGAREAEFNATSGDFLEGLSEDQVLFSVHKTFAYCGMTALPTFSVYGAMKLDSFDRPIKALQAHIRKFF
ncbi:NAD(P)H-dependent oxidoreductase [Shouchella sp. JSM 1781072]|uniref:NAD(P)H-dependent oxidoreductase n=1 Tax=Shouchella sp. JSM 1781072 TaxID=3344581 RepID=UPI0035C067F0